jgi:hypothetical protein
LGGTGRLTAGTGHAQHLEHHSLCAAAAAARCWSQHRPCKLQRGAAGAGQRVKHVVVGDLRTRRGSASVQRHEEADAHGLRVLRVPLRRGQGRDRHPCPPRRCCPSPSGQPTPAVGAAGVTARPVPSRGGLRWCCALLRALSCVLSTGAPAMMVERCQAHSMERASRRRAASRLPLSGA